MKKMLVLSNMYPSEDFPSYGVFVKNFEETMIENNIPFDKIVMLKKDKKILKVISYLYFFIKTFLTILIKDYSIIYIHYASITSIPVLWAEKFKNINIYTNVHGTDVMPVTTKEKKLEENTSNIINISTKVIVPSNYFKELVTEKYAINQEKVIVYPSGGIDKTVFYPKKRETTEKSELKGSKYITLGYVSRIEKEKGWKVLLDAINILDKSVNDTEFKLLIVGEGSERDLLKKYIKQHNLEEVVTMLSFVNQKKLSDLYSKMDLFIFPTFKESLGLVGLEAMACGVPVLGSDIPPLASYIKPNENGMLFEKNNPKDLVSKIYDFKKFSNEKKVDMKNTALKTSDLYDKRNIKKGFIKIFE